MNKKLKLALLLFLIGFVGVLSILGNHPIEIDKSESLLTHLCTLFQSNWPYLILPTINLLVAVVVGTVLHEKVNLRVPLLQRITDSTKKSSIKGIVPYGLIGGIISGASITVIFLAFTPTLSAEFMDKIATSQISLFTRVFNGAVTGEILHRFGFMTFLVWLGHKMSGQLTPSTYWTAIIASIVLFAAAEISPMLMMGNTISMGHLLYQIPITAISVTIAGWLYWRKGLEAAILAHVTANIILFFTLSGV